jgi:hypothetical protein
LLNLETKQLDQIRQYLLGLLAEHESEALDERLLTDGEFYDEVLVIEDELIDQYLNEGLSAEERKSFETHFLLTPERHEKLRFSRGFHSYLKELEPLPDLEPNAATVTEHPVDVLKPPPKPWYHSFLPIRNPALAYSLMAALVLVVAGVSWLALKNLNGPTDAGPVYAVTLNAGVTRGSDGSENRISIPPGTGTVELRPELRRDDYATYRAVLLSDEGSEISRADNLKSRTESSSRFVNVNVPAHLLPPGYYSLKVTGINANGTPEDLSSYRFRVFG